MQYDAHMQVLVSYCSLIGIVADYFHASHCSNLIRALNSFIHMSAQC